MKRSFLPLTGLALRCLAVLTVALVSFSPAPEPVFNVDTPRAFAPLRAEGQFAAMSPEGMIYRVRIMENSPKQTLEFWSEALTTHLDQEGYVPLSTDNRFVAAGIEGAYSEWSVPYGTDTYKYLTATLVADKTIAIAEASGVFDIYNEHRDALLASLESIVFVGYEPPELVTVTPVAPPAVQPTRQQAPASRSGCFVAGTPVQTNDGAIPIESLWPGTGLTVFNPSGNQESAGNLMRTVELLYEGELVTVIAGGELIEVTGTHPFLVASGPKLSSRRLPDELTAREAISPDEGRWVAARDLGIGDVLVGLSGGAFVESVSTRIGRTMVYHLALNTPHTYAVGSAGVVVHNASSEEAAPAEAYKAPLESATAARERSILGGGAISASLPTDARNERVRVYSGACSLWIDRIEQSKRAIASMAEEVEGYVEQSSDTRIVIRVPAASFREVYDEILNLGEVLYKAIETYDVTDQFTDPTGRLAVAIRARDRLYVLLERVEDPKERLDILQQIRTYTETIERLELSLEVLEQRIAMSRITVELYSREADVAEVERVIPFAWVDRLHPLYETTAALGEKAKITMPTDVAVFENGAVLRAEAADGTRVRVGTVRNDPQGDTEFWQRALIYHLESKYQKAEAVELDSLSLALFTSKDRDAYYYLVGTIPLVETEELVVVEVYFPHADALEKHYEDLLSSFGEVETS